MVHRAADRAQTGPFSRGELGCGSHSGPRWYCIQSRQHLAQAATRRLSDQGFTVYLPRIATGPLAAEVVKLLFPGYLFARFDTSTDQWRCIWGTFGVSRVMGANPERPQPVPHGVVEELISRGRADGVIDERISPPSLEGRTLRIRSGAFAGFEGVCQMSTDQRVRLLLSMLGRDVAVEALRAEVETV